MIRVWSKPIPMWCVYVQTIQLQLIANEINKSELFPTTSGDFVLTALLNLYEASRKSQVLPFSYTILPNVFSGESLVSSGDSVFSIRSLF